MCKFLGKIKSIAIIAFFSENGILFSKNEKKLRLLCLQLKALFFFVMIKKIILEKPYFWR